jgi:hypothetical protein
MQDLLIAATPPFVAAVLAAAGVWLRARSGTQRSARRVEEARAKIAVIKSVLDAHAGEVNGSHDDTREMLMADLDAAYRQMRVFEEVAQRDRAHGRAPDLARAVLLTDHHPRTFVAWSAYVLYYLSLAWALLWLATAIMFGLIGAFADTQESFGTRIATATGITVLALAIGLGPAIVLHLLARLAVGDGGAARSGPPTVEP